MNIAILWFKNNINVGVKSRNSCFMEDWSNGVMGHWMVGSWRICPAPAIINDLCSAQAILMNRGF